MKYTKLLLSTDGTPAGTIRGVPSLPILGLHPIDERIADPATRACAGCHGLCCVEHDVPVNGYELRRLRRALGVPWDALVRVEEAPTLHGLGFRLNRAPLWRRFYLLRRSAPDGTLGACHLLLEIGGVHRRCGVHALRPGACRIYPLLPNVEEPHGGYVSGHAICPPERAEGCPKMRRHVARVVRFHEEAR